MKLSQHLSIILPENTARREATWANNGTSKSGFSRQPFCTPHTPTMGRCQHGANLVLWGLGCGFNKDE